MVGGKHASEKKTNPSCKCTIINLEKKIRMIPKYEGWQSLSETAR